MIEKKKKKNLITYADKNHYKGSKSNLCRACLNVLRLSEFLMYSGSLFHSLLAINEKDLCFHSVLKWGCTKLLSLPLRF